jgi:hypothetical protein
MIGMAWEWLTPVATSAVGVAGIVGTVWGATAGRKTQIDVARIHADAERSRRFDADKREIYGRVLYIVHQFEEASYEVWLSAERREAAEKLAPPSEGDGSRGRKVSDDVLNRQVTALKNLAKLLSEFNRVGAEVAVVAGPTVADKVAKMIPAFRTIRETGKYEAYREATKQLVLTLNGDLLGTS